MLDWLIGILIYGIEHPFIFLLITIFILNLLSFKYYTTWFIIYEKTNFTDNGITHVYFLNLRVYFKSTLFKIYFTRTIRKNIFDAATEFSSVEHVEEYIKKYKERKSSRFESNGIDPIVKLYKITE